MDYSTLSDVMPAPAGREEAGAAQVGTLGNTGKSASPLGNTTKLRSVSDEELAVRRISRYMLQNLISEILPGERVANCLRLVVPGRSGVKILYSDQVHRAHYGGLTVCGSVWSCPICAAKITERRRLEVRPALERWEGGLIMAAYTLQHDRSNSLDQVKNALYSNYRTLMSGWAWQELKERWGIEGVISSSEVTWGAVYGWHPHKHALLFTKSKLSPGEIKNAETEISERFRSLLSRSGNYGHPQYSVQFRTGNVFEEGDYVFKWGVDYELTKSPVKKARSGNFSPFELASWAMAEGEAEPVALFREYFRSYKGSHQLQYSVGLRKKLGLDQEKSDLELALEEDQKAIELAELSRSVWSVICKRKLRGELIEVASSGSFEMVNEFLKGLGFALEGF